MTPEHAHFAVGERVRCQGTYVLHWEVSRLEVTLPRHRLWRRVVRCQVADSHVGRNPLEALGQPLPDDWRHHRGLRYRVVVDLTPLEEGRFGHHGLLTWRVRIDDWIEIEPA